MVRAVLKAGLSVAAVFAASLVSAAPGLADCADGRYDDPLSPTTSVTPGANAAIEQSYVYPVRFTVISPMHFAGFYVRVSRVPQLGQTGILSDLVGLDDTILTESATDPDYYFGQSSFTAVSLTTWTDVPGTYYWQLFGSWTDDAFACHAFAGPINAITITPSPVTIASAPAPSPPTTAQPAPSSPAPVSTPPTTTARAPGYAAQMIRARTGRRPHIHVRCTTADTRTLRCVLRWSQGNVSYFANGRFTRVAPLTLAYDFIGLRTRRRCDRRGRCSIRTIRFHWIGHSSTATATTP